MTIISADPGDLVIDGAQEVSWWVRGQEIQGELVYMLDRDAVRIARVIPERGRHMEVTYAMGAIFYARREKIQKVLFRQVSFHG